MNRTPFSILGAAFLTLTLAVGCGNKDRFAKTTKGTSGTGETQLKTAKECKDQKKFLSLDQKSCVSECKVENSEKNESAGKCECKDDYTQSKNSKGESICKAKTSLATGEPATSNSMPTVGPSEMDVTGDKELLQNKGEVPTSKESAKFDSKSFALKGSAKSVSCDTLQVEGSTAERVEKNVKAIAALVEKNQKESFELLSLEVINTDTECNTNAQPDHMMNYDIRYSYRLLDSEEEKSGEAQISALSHTSGLNHVKTDAGMKLYASCLDTSCDEAGLVFVIGEQAKLVVAQIKGVKPNEKAKLREK